MKQQARYTGARRSGTAIAVALACVLATAGMQAQAQGVQNLQPGQAVRPPPLPLGAPLVKVQVGMDDKEVKREAVAHHHKGHVKKDFTHDDSQDGPGKGNGNGNGKGNKS